MRARRLIGWSLAGGVGLAVMGGLLAFGPLVRGVAARRAAERGLTVEIGSVGLGWGALRLSAVQLSLAQVPAVEVRLDAVRVELGLNLRPTALAASDGKVQISGAVADVRAQLEAWAGAHAPKKDGERAQPRAALELDARNVHVGWEGPDVMLSADGVRGRRDPAGGVTLEVASANGEYGRVRVAGEGVVVRAGAGDSGLVVQQLSARTADVELRLDAASADPGPKDAAATAAADSGSRNDDASKAREGRGRPLAGKGRAGDGAGAGRRASGTSAASGTSDRRLLRGPLGFGENWFGERAHAQIVAGARWLNAHLLATGELALNGMKLRVRRASDVLNLGPGRLTAARDGEMVRIRWAPEGDDPGPTPLTLEAQLPVMQGDTRLHVEGGPVPLKTLGIQEGDFGLRDVGTALVEARGEFRLSAGGQVAEVSGSGRVQRLSVAHAALSDVPVRGIDVAWDLRAVAKDAGRALALDSLDLRFGEVRLGLSGNLQRDDAGEIAQLKFGVPLATCQSVLSATPAELLPLLAGVHMDGTFTIGGEVEFDTRHPLNPRVALDVHEDCKVRAFSRAVDPARFLKPWERDVKDQEGRELRVLAGPGTAAWVPYHLISPHLVTAVLVCEDGRFFRHDGFDFQAMRGALLDNLRAGRFARGASTISMQLAKNLYLSSQKTLARKLQEAILTLLLEQELSKHELIELYLNIIEYAPGVYGVGRAAPHYFNTTASELSLGQALYLASILPNPKQQHFSSNGYVSPGWSDYLRKLMHIARRIGRINDEELTLGLEEQVQFQAESGHVAATSGDAATPEDTPEPNFSDAAE